MFSLLGPAKPGSLFNFWLEPEASWVKKTQISLRHRKILLVYCSQEEEPTSCDGTCNQRVCLLRWTFSWSPFRPWMIPVYASRQPSLSSFR